MWVGQLLIFQRGMETIRRFIDFCGPAVYVVMFVLMGWILYHAGFDSLNLTLNDTALTTGQTIGHMINAALLVIAFGLYRLLDRRHPRALARIPPSQLGLWSFAVAIAHGAALMLVPIYLGLCSATAGTASASTIGAPVAMLRSTPRRSGSGFLPMACICWM